MKKLWIILIVGLVSKALADVRLGGITAGTGIVNFNVIIDSAPIAALDHGTFVMNFSTLSCEGTGIVCTDGGSNILRLTVTGGGGGGASSLAVGTGSAVAVNIVSSPTAIVNFSSDVFKVRFLPLSGAGTAFITLDFSSVTAQGNVLLTVSGSTNALASIFSGFMSTTISKNDWNAFNSTNSSLVADLRNKVSTASIVLSGNIALTAIAQGANVNLSQLGSTLTIAASGSGSGSSDNLGSHVATMTLTTPFGITASSIQAGYGYFSGSVTAFNGFFSSGTAIFSSATVSGNAITIASNTSYGGYYSTGPVLGGLNSNLRSLYIADGSKGTPSLVVGTSLTSGFYNGTAGAADLRYTINNNDVLLLNSDVTVTGGVVAGQGTAATPSYRYGTGPNSGIFMDSSLIMGLSARGTRLIRAQGPGAGSGIALGATNSSHSMGLRSVMLLPSSDDPTSPIMTVSSMSGYDYLIVGRDTAAFHANVEIDSHVYVYNSSFTVSGGSVSLNGVGYVWGPVSPQNAQVPTYNSSNGLIEWKTPQTGSGGGGSGGFIFDGVQAVSFSTLNPVGATVISDGAGSSSFTWTPQIFSTYTFANTIALTTGTAFSKFSTFLTTSNVLTDNLSASTKTILVMISTNAAWNIAQFTAAFSSISALGTSTQNINTFYAGFTSTSDAQQNKFINFRTTTDANFDTLNSTISKIIISTTNIQAFFAGFTSTSDVRGNTFVNFRSTTDSNFNTLNSTMMAIVCSTASLENKMSTATLVYNGGIALTAFVQGANITLTQSGSSLTIAGGGGSGITTDQANALIISTYNTFNASTAALNATRYHRYYWAGFQLLAVSTDFAFKGATNAIAQPGQGGAAGQGLLPMVKPSFSMSSTDSLRAVLWTTQYVNTSSSIRGGFIMTPSSPTAGKAVQWIVQSTFSVIPKAGQFHSVVISTGVDFCFSQGSPGQQSICEFEDTGSHWGLQPNTFYYLEIKRMHDTNKLGANELNNSRTYLDAFYLDIPEKYNVGSGGP